MWIGCSASGIWIHKLSERAQDCAAILRRDGLTKERLLPMLVHEMLIAFVAKTARGVYGKYGASDIHEEVRWV